MPDLELQTFKSTDQCHSFAAHGLPDFLCVGQYSVESPGLKGTVAAVPVASIVAFTAVVAAVYLLVVLARYLEERRRKPPLPVTSILEPMPALSILGVESDVFVPATCDVDQKKEILSQTVFSGNNNYIQLQKIAVLVRQPLSKRCEPELPQDLCIGRLKASTDLIAQDALCFEALEVIPSFHLDCTADQKKERLRFSKSGYDTLLEDTYKNLKRQPSRHELPHTYKYYPRVTSHVDIKNQQNIMTVYYVIDVDCIVDDTKLVRWKLYRRYSEFRTVYRNIKKSCKFSSINNFQFPPKENIFSDIKEVVTTRLVGLDSFVQLMARLEPLPLIAEDFLQLESSSENDSEWARKNFQRIINVQAVFRGFRTRAAIRRQQEEKLRKAAISIQTSFRRWDLQKDYQTSRKGIVLLQALCQVRKHSKNFKRAKQASLKIQTTFRRWTCQKDLQKSRKGVILLQAVVRMKKPQKDFHRTKQAIVCIQTSFRRWDNQKVFQKARKGAILLQALSRMKKHKKLYHRSKQAVVCVQTSFRRWDLQKDFQKARKGSIFLQAIFRMKKRHADYCRAKQASLCIQTCFRRWNLQKDYQKARKGVIFLQAICRKCKQQKDYRRSKKAAVCIQTSFRRWDLQKDYQKAKKSVVFLQACFRMKKLQADYRRAKQAIISIQTSCRRWDAQKKYQQTRTDVILLQAICRKNMQQNKYQAARSDIIVCQSAFRMWLVRLMLWRKRELAKQRDEGWIMLRAVLRIQSVFRGKIERLRLEMRKKAHQISINFDVTCKQLLVANRSEFYNIFKSYMDKVQPAIKRKNAVLFAVNFRLVPLLVTKHRFDELITELVQILNEDPDSKDIRIETTDAPLHFIAYLRLLILLARESQHQRTTENLSLGIHLSQLLQLMDEQGGKQKMGGSLSRNTFSTGNMIYAGSPKLPSPEKALAFDIHKWLVETHFRGLNFLQARTPTGASARAAISLAAGSESSSQPKKSPMTATRTSIPEKTSASPASKIPSPGTAGSTHRSPATRTHSVTKNVTAVSDAKERCPASRTHSLTKNVTGVADAKERTLTTRTRSLTKNETAVTDGKESKSKASPSSKDESSSKTDSKNQSMKLNLRVST